MVVLGTKHNMKVCILAVLMACVSNARATTYYVDGQRGNDSNNGQSTSASWRTVAKANSTVQAGDIVYLRAGTYNETIRPEASGTAGNYITYSRYSHEEVVITGVTDGVDLRDRHYVIIDGLKIVNVSGYWVNLKSPSDSSTHNIIQNCHMEAALGWAGIWLKGNVYYNRVRNNTLIGYASPDDVICMTAGAHHNVIEENDIRYGAHDSIDINKGAPRNVIRNNRIRNPWHTAVDVYNSSDHTLVEGNIVLDAGADHENIPLGPVSDGDRQMTRDKHRRHHNGIKVSSADCIIRNNVLVNNGMMEMDTYSATSALRNRIYGNTLYKNYDGIYSESGNAVDENVIKNNIVSTSVEYEISSYISQTNGENDNYYFHNNVTGAPLRFNYLGGTKDLSHLQSTYPTYFQNNREQDPLFASTANINRTDNTDFDATWLHLRSTSPMIDRGTFLTTASSAGSGTVISVKDASYFYDGWGIPDEQGDLIQLQGQTQTARIVSIDYGNNRITVNKSLSWSAGQGVALPYKGATPDIGAFEYASTGTTYTLVADGTHGTVTKDPDQASYETGTTVTLQAKALDGYQFSGWAGSISGATNPTTITMNADKSITATFALAPTLPTYTLNTSATHGTITKDPVKETYDSGDVVTVEAVAADGYEFTGWSGSLSGSANPATITMNANASVTAGFTAVATTPTYTLNTAASNGTITKTPNKTTFNAEESVTIEAVASAGYEFSGWSGSLSGATNPATIAMNADKSITATFVEQVSDKTPPVVAAISPKAEAVQAPINSLICLRISDAGDGVDGASVTIALNGQTVYTGDVASYEGDTGVCRRAGTPAGYTYAYQAEADFECDETVTLTVNARDLAGNAMSQYTYAFRTEMIAFGRNKKASWGPEGLDKSAAAAARDSLGNVWVVWHAGATGQRDIYISAMLAGEEAFTDPVQLTNNAADQSDPDIAIGSDDKLWVTWQDNRQGHWDIYVATSTNGVIWSTQTPIADSDDNQTAPAITLAGSQCYIAYEDDGAGHQDVYVAGSSNGFASQTTSRVTSHASDQTAPVIAADASGNVYLLWTDERNGSEDIYGAASNDSWSNVPVVTGAGNQHAPVLAVEAGGTTLHLAWSDDVAGHSDIYYASSSGLPASPLTGTNLVDDTSPADQVTPAIAVTGSAGDGLRVFVCWQDWRNVTSATEDTDLYFVEVEDGDETNVLVGDGASNSRQREPVLGVDLYGHPFVVWGDYRGTHEDIFYAGATFWAPEKVASKTVTASTGGTVGTVPPTDTDDTSVRIPAGAASQDMAVSIMKVENPQALLTTKALSYEFGPSGSEFVEPVTITIPYAVDEFGQGGLVPYWYDALTDSLSQEGITDIEDIAISATVRAVQFKTTHFTSFYLVSSTEEGLGGSAGGGCSLSPTGEGRAAEFFLPYAILAGVMLVLRRRDRRARQVT